MRITEFADVITGNKIETSDLTSVPNNLLYIQPFNIERSIAISEENAKYIIERNYKKLSAKLTNIEYGDYLIFRLKGDLNYSLLRFTQDLNKKIFPSDNFIILRNIQSFLLAFLQHEIGRNYFLKEIEDITNRSNGNFVEIVKQLKLIDIDPIIFEQIKSDNYISPGNTPISEDDLKKINVRGADVITIDNIYKRLKEKEIRLEGYFQRKSNLWADDVKSRLIETIILNMPIPPLFFDISNDDKWLIVDGLQRISAIKSFYENDLALINLDYIPELEGKRFSDLSRLYQRKFEERQMSFFAIYPGTPRSVRYKIFKNINVSAIVLNRQEIRHAINEDEDAEFTPSRYIFNLTQTINKYLIISEKGERGKERMFDSELCLRYVAFRVLNQNKQYLGNIQDFLDKAMEIIYTYQRNKLNVFHTDFESALITILQIFPAEIAFTKAMVQKDGPTNFNSNLFGVWTYLVSTLNDEERNKLILKSKQIKEFAQLLSNNREYERSIDSRYFETIESLKIHIDFTDKFIKSFLND